MPTKPLTFGTVAVGDCVSTMSGWPADSADLIFADPPYNIGFKYDRYNDNRRDEDYTRWTGDWIDACARLLKPTGSLYVLIGDEYAAETRLILKRLQREGRLLFRNWIVWHYTFGQHTKIMFNRSHAHLFYCVGSAALTQKRIGGTPGRGRWRDDLPTAWVPRTNLTREMPFTFNRQAIAVASARQTTYTDARANPKGKVPDDTWYLRPQEAMSNGGGLFEPDQDTWALSRLCGTFKERLGWHPCQLPEALLERIVKLSSDENDVVFDPFVGSGTTLAVAARLGRRWLGCELSEDYARKAVDRIEHAAETGETLQATMAEKGIERGKPKKKAEPHRSPKPQLF